MTIHWKRVLSDGTISFSIHPFYQKNLGPPKRLRVNNLQNLVVVY
jgi:hypothetical protein